VVSLSVIRCDMVCVEAKLAKTTPYGLLGLFSGVSRWAAAIRDPEDGPGSFSCVIRCTEGQKR
jgi:hypothetical protein